MRLPVRAITGHLIWGRDGSVWSVYRVESFAYAHLSTRDKLALHGKLRGLLMALPAASRLLSVCRRLDPGLIVDRMIDDVDLARRPVWSGIAEQTLELLSGIELFERRNYLAVKLPEEGTEGWRSALGAAISSLTDGLLPSAPIPARSIELRARQAATVEAQLGSFSFERASAGELRWLYARALRRGIFEPYLDESWEPQVRILGEGLNGRVATPSLVNLGDAIVKEGGYPDDPGRPRHRRYLRVETPHGVAYQTYLAVAEMPREFLFPGGNGEWFHHLNSFPYPVDWCVLLTAVPNQTAQARSRKQQRELANQVSEWESEPSGAPSSLAAASAGLDSERSELSANPAIPECEATIVFSLAASSLDELEAQAAHLQSAFQPNEYALPRPTGGQASLATAMLPGSSLPQVARDYTQYLLPRDLAASMPFAGVDVGDDSGMLLGYTLDGGTFQPVLFDPAWGPAHDRSGSIGIFGALGYGKSQTAKVLAYGALARGHQVVIVDRTSMGEYAQFSKVAPGTAQVVRLDSDTQVCLDPMRVFRGSERVQRTIGFLTLLTGTSATDLEGMALAKAVREAAADPSAGLLAVVEALRRRDDDAAKVVRQKVEGHAEGDLAHLAFGDGEALTLEADCIVFHTPNLSLPTKEQLSSEYLARRLLPEQIFGQALLYLVAAVSRSVIFANRARFGVQLLDEASFLVASPQGLELVLEGIRDGRKHNAALWVLSQHPHDLMDDRLADLLGAKLVFRQSRGAAPAALRFLEMDTDDLSAV
ncbi:MAG TPA: ATP-binding protein, partial [Actinomycetes bacterium]|nr:ATP-binding protein [Actinomycetes bacterium]